MPLIGVGVTCAELRVPHVPTFSPVRGPRLPWIEPRSPGTVEPVPFPHGTLMALRRDCLSEVGLFDERYFAYGDEIELGLRANRRGWQVTVTWGAVVENPISSPSGAMKSYLFARNTLLLAECYGGFHAALLRAAGMMINNVRFLVQPSAAIEGLSVRARLRGMRDFFLRRFGPPPPDLCA